MGRVINWNKGKDYVTIEMIDENGYHCVGTVEYVGWHSSRERLAAAYKTASMPPIASGPCLPAQGTETVTSPTCVWRRVGHPW